MGGTDSVISSRRGDDDTRRGLGGGRGGRLDARGRQPGRDNLIRDGSAQPDFQPTAGFETNPPPTRHGDSAQGFWILGHTGRTTPALKDSEITKLQPIILEQFHDNLIEQHLHNSLDLDRGQVQAAGDAIEHIFFGYRRHARWST
jgi:hypothetical protein